MHVSECQMQHKLYIRNVFYKYLIYSYIVVDKNHINSLIYPKKTLLNLAVSIKNLSMLLFAEGTKRSLIDLIDSL